MDLSNMIPLSDWAKKNGIKPGTVQKWVQRGKLTNIEKAGGVVFVNADTELPSDNRKNSFLNHGEVAIFKERLKELRKEKNITQKALAELCGVDQSTYAPYETGGNVPPVERIKILANFFGVTVDYLMGESDKRN